MSHAIEDYPSRLNAPDARKLGTFSYLPEMDPGAIRKQIEHMIAQGWDCAIEHVEPERTSANYWYMWKLPMFAEADIDTIVAELEACRAGNPRHHVQLIGYDRRRQTRGHQMVVHRAPA